MEKLKENKKTNVVEFPVIDNFMKPVDGQIELVKAKSDYNIEAVEFIYDDIIAKMTAIGVIAPHRTDRYNENDFMLIYEAISSALNRYQKLSHPLHFVVDDFFIMDENEEEIEPYDEEEND